MTQYKLDGLLWSRADELDTDGLFTSPIVDSLSTGEAPVNATLTSYRTNIVTGGTAGTEVLGVPDGAYPGQRKLFWLQTRTDGADVVSFTMTNIEENLIVGGGAAGAATALVLDAANEYALLEWTGAKWNIVYTNGTLTT